MRKMTMQVDRHPILIDRASELPSVAPAVTGKPHKHAYVGSSRITGKSNWGPQQVALLGQFVPCANMLSQ